MICMHKYDLRWQEKDEFNYPMANAVRVKGVGAGALQMADTIRRMRFATPWRAAFRVKSFKVAVIRRKWLGGGQGERGRGGEGVMVGD